MYIRIGPALQHVLQATRAHMLYLRGNVALSQEIAKNIQPVAEMSLESQAGIEGVKAKFSLTTYKKRDILLALKASQRAVELDPNCGAWQYLTGKTMRKLRRECKKKMSRKELEYFEKAVELERNPKHLVFLAQAYQEMARSSLLQSVPEKEEAMKKSVELYSECWRLNNTSAAIARRVGNGMMLITKKYRDLTVTQEALLKAVETSPNEITFHVLARFYFYSLKDSEKAFECAKKAGKLFGTRATIKYKIITDPEWDPHDTIQEWAEFASTWPKPDPVYCEIGWYYLYYKNDLNMATKYFWKVLQKDFNSPNVKRFGGSPFCISEPINMIKVLVNEILLEKEKNEVLPPKSKKDMTYLEDFLEKVFENHPSLEEMKPNPFHWTLIKKLKVVNYIKVLREFYCNGNQTINDTELPLWLEHAESPFKWMVTLKRSLGYILDVSEKMMDYRNQGADYGFEKYSLLLKHAAYLATRDYEDFRANSSEDESSEDESSEEEDEFEGSAENKLVDNRVRSAKTEARSMETEAKSTETEAKSTETEAKSTESKAKSAETESMFVVTRIRSAEEAYIKCKEALDEMAAREGDIMYSRIGPALQHVLQATRAHMLYLIGNEAESKEVAKDIQPVSEMSSENLAGIEGIKAKYILSCYQDVRVALEASRKAMEIDPNFAAWAYLSAKIIRNLRRKFREEMPREELEFFEKAVQLERNPKYIVFLAQAYQEMAQTLLSKSRDQEISKAADDMLRKSVELFRECWRLKNDSAAISRRVGNGMMKIRNDLMDLDLAKEALLKAVELSPNLVTIHELGRFYYKHEQNDEKALECFEKLEGIYGPGEIIRMHLIKDPEYDPIKQIQYWELLAWHLVKGDEVFCDLGWYYLMYKKDLETAAKYFWNAMTFRNSNFKFFRVMEFQSYAFCVTGPINMIEVLVNEILLEKEKNKVLPAESKTNMTNLDMFLEKMLKEHPALENMSPNPNLIETIRGRVERYIRSRRHWRYGNPGHSTVRSEVARSWRRDSHSEDGRFDESAEGGHDRRSYFRENTNNRGGVNNRYGSNREYNRDRYDSNRENVTGGMNTRNDFNREYNRCAMEYNRDRYDSNRENVTGGMNTRNDFNREYNRGGMNNGNGSTREEDRGEMIGRQDSNRENIRGGMSNQHDFNRNYNRGGIEYNRDRYDSNRENDRDRMSNRYNTPREGGVYNSGMQRQYNNQNRGRYDVTVTDWRKETKK